MKALDKWLDRVKDTATPWTESEIIYFRRAIGSSGLKDRNVARSLLEQFETTLDNMGGYTITQEQTEKGLNYLRNACFKKNGMPRETEQSSEFGCRERDVILAFDRFELVGVHDAGYRGYNKYSPVYRVYSEAGEHFDYTVDMGLMRVIG